MRDGSDEDGPAERRKAARRGERREAVCGLLGKAETGVDHESIPRHAVADGALDSCAAARARRQSRRHRSAPRRYMSRERPRVCISTSAGAARGDHRAEAGIIPQPTDVVDDGDALVERAPCGLGAVGIDRERDTAAGRRAP